jgi:hypothetical protein
MRPAQTYEGNINNNAPLPKEEEVLAGSEPSGTTLSHSPGFDGPDDGSWAAVSASGSVSLNGFDNEGVWLQGESGPACTFSGYLVTE